jgi:WD40 repeat protein
MSAIEKYYRVLELNTTASLEDVKQAYRRLAKQWHPDRYHNNPTALKEAEERIKTLNLAYQALCTHHTSNSSSASGDHAPKSSTATPQTPRRTTVYTTQMTAEMLYQRGAEQSKLRNYTAAIAEFSAAIRLDPNYAAAYRYRGLIYSVLGQEYRAASDLSKADELEKGDRRTATSSKPPPVTSPHSPQAASILTEVWSKTHTWIESTGAIAHCAVSRDGRLLATISQEGTIRLVNLQTFKSAGVLGSHRGGGCVLAFSPNLQLLTSGGQDGSIHLWHLKTGNLMRTLSGHDQGITALLFSWDGTTLISASWDHHIRLWDLRSGKEQGCLMGHTAPILAIALSSDGQTLASAGADHTVRLWKLATRSSHRIWPLGKDCASAVLMSPNRRDVILGTMTGELQRWNLESGQMQQRVTAHPKLIRALALSPDGQRCVSASDDQTVRCWTMNLEQVPPPLHHDHSVGAIAFTRDGQMLVSVSGHGAIAWRRGHTS